jgi:hypothetical protein
MNKILSAEAEVSPAAAISGFKCQQMNIFPRVCPICNNIGPTQLGGCRMTIWPIAAHRGLTANSPLFNRVVKGPAASAGAGSPQAKRSRP